MGKESVMVGVANEGEISVNIEDLKTWQPKNISYFSDVVYFRNDKTYFSMKRITFDQIFKK